jgi:hypothetical protein
MTVREQVISIVMDVVQAAPWGEINEPEAHVIYMLLVQADLLRVPLAPHQSGQLRHGYDLS